MLLVELNTETSVYHGRLLVSAAGSADINVIELWSCAVVA